MYCAQPGELSQALGEKQARPLQASDETPAAYLVLVQHMLPATPCSSSKVQRRAESGEAQTTSSGTDGTTRLFPASAELVQRPHHSQHESCKPATHEFPKNRLRKNAWHCLATNNFRSLRARASRVQRHIMQPVERTVVAMPSFKTKTNETPLLFY